MIYNSSTAVVPAELVTVQLVALVVEMAAVPVAVQLVATAAKVEQPAEKPLPRKSLTRSLPGG